MRIAGSVIRARQAWAGLRERSRIWWLWRLARTARPRTFNEKVRYKMARDHRPLLVTFADKAAVRDYIAGAVGAQYLPAAYAITNDARDLRHLRLPRSYVLKPTHGSGAVVAVSDSAPPGGRLPNPEGDWACVHVRPDVVDVDQLVELAAEWLGRPYGEGPNHEWAYSHVVPRIVVEECLRGPDGGIPDDYKLFVFNQRCRYVQVDAGRFDIHTQDFFTADWTRVPMSGGPPFSSTPPIRPQRLPEMISLAERLARDTDFVRVDMFVLPERIVVGELTSYPAGGQSPFYPESFNAEFGRAWTVPRRYR